ncbi:hypothetical protein ERN12_04160 [Rhodobacteraceae bacterium]|nr:hypothetical protein ERN12_04160 [Paracoccaceae bacterium]
MFDHTQLAKMADLLVKIKCAFVLSINDTPEIREFFSAFAFDEASIKYSVASSGATDAHELIISTPPKRRPAVVRVGCRARRQLIQRLSGPVAV